MRWMLSWALYATAIAIWEVVLPIHDRLLYWSVQVQGEGTGPWETPW